MLNLNNLQIKAFGEFILNPLFNILQEFILFIYISNVIGIGKSQEKSFINFSNLK